MSNPGQNIVNAPALEVTASDAAYGRTFAPRTNAALELANSVAGLNESINQASVNAKAYLEKDAAVAAKKAALEGGGPALAAAVRDGTILGVENPYLMRDYARESGYLHANSAISNLQVQSQEWPEAADPAAFQARWAKELATIGQAYTDPDSVEGFVAAAAPATQQAAAANTATVSATIMANRESNLSALIVQSIADVNKQFGGHASPDQIFNALEPLKAHYVGTGGTDPGWNKLLYSGVTSAAYNSQNPGLLDILDHKRPGGGVPLASLPGIADQMANDRYHIMQASGMALRQQADDIHSQAVVAGQGILNKAYADPRYGTKLLTGDFDVQTFIREHSDQPVAAIMSALNSIQSTVADSQALSIARVRAFEVNPGSATYILGLHTRAASEGYTPELHDEVGQLVLRGDLGLADANSILEKALSTTQAAQPNSGVFGPSKGRVKDLKNAATAFGSLRASVQADITTMVTSTNTAARVHQKAGMSPADSKNLQSLATQAASAYLATHQGDFAGARRAGQDAAGYWMQAHIGDYVNAAGGVK